MSRFYSSNFIIATAASFLSLFYALKSSTDFSLEVPLLIFCATLIVYHLQRIAQDFFHKSLGHELKVYYQSFKRLIWGIISISTVTIVFLASQLNQRQIFLLALGLLLSFFYIKIPFSTLSLRSIAYSKPITIALVWANSIGFLMTNQLFYFFDCFIFILLLAAAFDIKDIQEDLEDGVVTCANKSLKVTRILLLLASSLYSGAWLLSKDWYFALFLPTYFYLVLSRPAPWKYYLGLDGLIILRLIVYLCQH